MSVSIGVFTAAVMFLAVGEETNLEFLMDWSLEMGSGGCRGEQAHQKHTRLIDAEACVSKLYTRLRVYGVVRCASLPRPANDWDGRGRRTGR